MNKLDLKYEIDPESDAKVISSFLRLDEKAGSQFKAQVSRDLEGITEKSSDEEILKLVKAIYEKEIQTIESFCQKALDDWNHIQPQFCAAIQQLFKTNFHDYDVLFMPSIVELGPRWLDEKWFMIWYRYKQTLDSFMHELTHFYFFDYVDLHIPELRGLNKKDGSLWDVSEIFNNVVLMSEPFVTLLNGDKEIPYPAHLKYLDQANQLYKQKKSTPSFIHELYDLVSAN